MPIRQFVGEADWQTEITGWSAYGVGQGAITTYKPVTANEIGTLALGKGNLGDFGGTSGSESTDKCLKIYHKLLNGKFTNLTTGKTRLYDLTATVSVSELTLVSGGAAAQYAETIGNPLVSYNYPANDVLFCQVTMSMSTTNSQQIVGMILGRVLTP